MFDYEIFFRFLDQYKAQRFQDIDPEDALMKELTEKLESTGQFFHIADVLQLKIIYFSNRCHEFFGVACEQMDPAIYMQSTHTNDIQRHSVGRSKLIKLGADMYVDRRGPVFLSSNLSTKDKTGQYRDLLYQLCVCYSDVPAPAVYSLQVNTDVTGILDKGLHGYHYYVGPDKSYFRYPDKELLSVGNLFSSREFEIIKCISSGLDSYEIAEKLFLSVHTINTHRRNILLKTGKRSTHELVIDLQERGVI